MTHIWLRAERRPNEDRTGLMPSGAAALLKRGFKVSVEHSQSRVIETQDYADIGCDIAAEGSWYNAPDDAIILGLKELPEDGSRLKHRHIMFGHAFKGQHSGQTLLHRFKEGGGTLYDLEYLTDEDGRRVAAFGYWAGFAGAAVSLLALAAQKKGRICPPVKAFANQSEMVEGARDALQGMDVSAIVIGALGRVGTGASDLCESAGLQVAKWDIEETARGAPFPEILSHDVFLNCILARFGTPVFVPKSALSAARRLCIVGDIACDPDSDYNPVPVYSEATTWDRPVTRVHINPPLDVMAIDNLPSLLPRESSQDFADQLLPYLLSVDSLDQGVWQRARHEFDSHIQKV
ncbi:MAG: saccharopine dehydrogenase [Pseudomonadota bacterium]